LHRSSALDAPKKTAAKKVKTPARVRQPAPQNGLLEKIQVLKGLVPRVMRASA
jgi:hypothetical protein